MTNSSESTGTFRRKLTSADASNIVSVLDMLALNGKYQQFEEDFILGFAGMLESLQVSVGLWSLKPADFPNLTPLMSEAQKQAELYRIRDVGQKMSVSFHVAKGNGPWEYVSECVLMNQGNNESYVSLLVPFLTANEVLLIDRDFRLGVKVESKWQGPLKSGDYLVISGSWRQRVTFTAKKNESEVLAAKVEALELALYGRLTGLPANSLLGSVAGGVAESLDAEEGRELLGLGSAALLDFSLPLSVENGGTGSSSKNFVDLANTQTVSGIKSFGPELRVVNSAFPKIVFNATGNGIDIKKFQMFITTDGRFFFAPLNDAENVSNGAFTISSSGTINFPTTTQSTSTTTGGAIFGGGAGIALNLNVGGTIKAGGYGILSSDNAHNYNINNTTKGIFSGDQNIDGTTKGWHWLTDIRASNTHGIQVAFCDTADKIMYRSYQASVWQPWKTVTIT